MQKLWTRDFTIITVGTVISMLGNAISGFAISLLVLDFTGSTFLYALFMVAYNLPKVVMPLMAGPYLDRFSRKKVIYGLDFLSAGIYLAVFLILRQGWFFYPMFLALCLLIGSIDGVYQVAYDSLYPTLISEGNYRKAYSISSLIYPLSTIMIPVAAFLYGKVGLEPMFAFNAVSFLLAAIFETRIKGGDTHQLRSEDADAPPKMTLRQFRSDFAAGLQYIRDNPGLLYVTAYFAIQAFTAGPSSSLLLPYFKSAAGLGVVLYTFVMGCNVVGRFIGGLAHYRFRYPTDKKTYIALGVYITTVVIEGVFLYLPIGAMMALQLASGLLAVTSFNIRISGTQHYVPDAYRGRFNGTFTTMCTLGSIAGQLLGGALGEIFPTRPLIAAFMVLNFLAIFLTVFRGRNSVKQVYNQDL